MMDAIEKQQTLEHIAKAHNLVEKNYLLNPSAPGSAEWLNKRRLLLADLSLHLTDACVREGLDIEKLKRHLYSILIIANDFAPEAGLKRTAQNLLPEATT